MKLKDQKIIEIYNGTITAQLFPKYVLKTVENFVKLAEKNYYDDVIFHRVIWILWIQGGDHEPAVVAKVFMEPTRLKTSFLKNYLTSLVLFQLVNVVRTQWQSILYCH